MPAVSQAQQRFFAMCEHGVHTKAACPTMSKGKMREWAATPRTGLPKRKGPTLSDALGRGRSHGLA